MQNAIMDFKASKGKPLPFGVSGSLGQTNFAIYCEKASRVKLLLFQKNNPSPVFFIELDSSKNKTGCVWHITLYDLLPDLLYAYEIEYIDSESNAVKTAQLILDPYAKELSTSNVWGNNEDSTDPLIRDFYHPKGLVLKNVPFDWENSKHPRTPLDELIIYEMHVRGLTQDKSSGVKHPGGFLGVVEKIPHFLDLGINAVELLPIHEFNEMENPRVNPITNERLFNYWGYSTVNYFSPMNRYASTNAPGQAIQDFKTMVRELHKNGIEVILDVVYNHTAEGNEKGPIISFKGLADSVYYLIEPPNKYLDFTGCGNTFNCNHPVALDLILNSLRYWVIEMKVDGFRFDLASAMTRSSNGEPLALAPIVEAISKDPILAETKLIAESWDAVGLYQVGSFYPQEKRWCEWNGIYRDTIRRFLKGTPGLKGDFVTRLCGSQDLYHNRGPCTSINFITCHDGFTLNDLVSYNHKHNLENGEDNNDGSGFNDSWNCGVEGTTDDPEILALRERQMRNFHLALMVSLGIPMLHMGDEYGHTKKGNNNTYCQDNELNWFLWNKLESSKGLYRFYRLLIYFRKNHPILRRKEFLTDKDVIWHGFKIETPLWEQHTQFVAYTLLGHENESDLYIAFNAKDVSTEVELPANDETKKWYWIVDTSKPSPEDFIESEKSKPVLETRYMMMGHSAILLKKL